MKILFHFTITLLVLSLAACNQTKSPEPVKQYTFIGGKEGDKMDTTSFDSLQLSDPFILADEETQMYYLVGSGGSLWKSTNLKMWTGPYQYITVDTTSWIGTAPRIWAPELHKYKGKYYCFVTFTNPKIIVDTVPNRYNVQRRATHILTSDKAAGPYHPISGTDYLPEDWSTLDGSFWESALYGLLSRMDANRKRNDQLHPACSGPVRINRDRYYPFQSIRCPMAKRNEIDR